MTHQWRTRLADTEWHGSAELWLDPEGNSVDRSDSTLRIEADAIHYTWSYEGQPHEGCFTFEGNGAMWLDSWHQPEPTVCGGVPGAAGLFTVEHTYGPEWGWRTKLSERPNGDLVLQMTNVAPWGEEGRAVRMTFTRTDSSAEE
jgi:hypothetical protein